MDLKELSDFQIGQVKGFLACQNGENIMEALALEQNVDTRAGMRWAFSKNFQNAFDDKIETFKVAAKSDNAKMRNIAACRILDYNAETNADGGRYQIITSKDGKSRVEEVYSSDEVEEVKSRLDEDPTLEIVEQSEDGSIFLAKKEDSLENFYNLINNVSKTPWVKGTKITNTNKALIILSCKDFEAFETFLKEFSKENGFELYKIDSPESIYTIKSPSLTCNIVCVDEESQVEAQLYYDSAPWYIDFLNQISQHTTGKILTPFGVFNGEGFENFTNVVEVYDSLGVSNLIKYNRY